MRPWSAIVALLVTTALILSGCMEPMQEGNQTNDERDDGDDDASPIDDPPGSVGNETDGNETRYEPICKAEPADHEVDSVDDIECAGQYTVLNAGSGETWNVPAWEVGDWWEYETEMLAGGTQCAGEREEVDDDSETQHNASVYTMLTEQYGCDEEPTGENQQTHHRIQDHLMQIMDGGTVAYNTLFPLKEGKSWVYMAGSGELIEIDDVSYDSTYIHGQHIGIEAWTVKWTIEYDDIEVEFEENWGVNVKNLLKQKITYTSPDYTFIVEKTLEDSSYDISDGPLPVLK